MQMIYNFYINIFGFYNTWMLWLSGIVLFLIFFILLCIKRYKDANIFIKMQRYGVVWKWRHEKNQIINLSCYCPECDSKIIFDDEHSRESSLGDKCTFLICENCEVKEKGRVKGGDREYVLKLIKNDIQRQISNQNINLKV